MRHYGDNNLYIQGPLKSLNSEKGEVIFENCQIRAFNIFQLR